MTARIATVADTAELHALYERFGRPALESAGYEAMPLAPADVSRELRQPRSTWIVAEDQAGVVRGFLEAVRSKSTPSAAWIARFALHGGVSLRRARLHRDEMAAELWRRLPVNFSIEVPDVRPNALLAREYCDALMTPRERPDGARDYFASVAALRLATTVTPAATDGTPPP